MSPRADPALVSPSGVRVALRCDSCEVLWRGPAHDPCWSCGREGLPAAAVIIVPG